VQALLLPLDERVDLLDGAVPRVDRFNDLILLLQGRMYDPQIAL